MENLKVWFMDLTSVMTRELSFLVIIFIISSLFYFFILYKNHKRKLETRNATEGYFWVYVVLIVFSFILFIAGSIVLYSENNYPMRDVLINIVSSKNYYYFYYGMCIYFLFAGFKIIFGMKQKFKVYAAQHRLTDFKMITDNRKKFTHKDMKTISKLYSFDGERKKYLNNSKTPKLTLIPEDLSELSEFQIELLRYLYDLTQEDIVKEKYFEFEVLRLIQITIDRKLDLIIGQFRLLTKTEQDEEIIGAIYNLRSSSITNQGYQYYLQYVRKEQYKKENKNVRTI